MRLFLVGVLLHELHEEDEENGGRGDTNDDGDHHEAAAEGGDNDDVAVAHCDLRHNLVVDACDEVVEVFVDVAGLGGKYPSMSSSCRGSRM
jgi:hypothetical protein